VYVNFMEMYGSAWGHKVDEEIDISRYPDWTLVDEQGREDRSLWGVNNKIEGLYYTSMHQTDLHDNAVAFVRKVLEESGADDVFVDNAGGLHNCYGDRIGRHKHVSGKTNTDMYEVLLAKIYKAVKDFGEDKIVMLNSGIIPSHWAYSDAQMYESTDFGYNLRGTMDSWQDLQYMGELHSEAIRKGKVPVVISYMQRCPSERKLEAALGTYAFAKLYGFLWADFFDLWAKEDTRGLAREIYGIRLGKPLAEARKTGQVCFREFEKGLVLVNTGSARARVRIAVRSGNTYRDTGYQRTISADHGRISLDIEPLAGRILLEQ